MKYSVEIKVSPKSKFVDEMTFEVDKEIDSTTYDDVLDAACGVSNDKYPMDDFPSLEFTHFFVFDGEKKYPVLAESEKKEIKRLTKDKTYEKFLVLPECRYALTEESRLWFEMLRHGVIPMNEPFDFNKYHKMLKLIRIDGECKKCQSKKNQKKKK